MVFSSLLFLFVFLPITVLGYYLIIRITQEKLALVWLVLASLFFYAYWKFSYLWIILLSIIVNYSLALFLDHKNKYRKPLFIIGLVFNIGMLFYFKYTNFLVLSLNRFLGIGFNELNILLPIGISFYTFQQIAFLTDVYKQESHLKRGEFLQYSLFVTFFPQLIAGPIVHHEEMIPQLEDKNNHKINWKNIYLGLCFLAIGLGKKVLIADQISPLVKYVFDISADLTILEAILGSLAYTLQLYFDFSGYGDMAIGLGLFFNINFPQNFNSPYKATSIQDFWRRWHITLSRWLQKYLYIPLGGNRGSFLATLRNLFLTFVIGGIWHGAGWTFLLWGMLHGGALVTHRLWTKYTKIVLPNILSQVITFIFLCLAWIPFRATNIGNLKKFVKGLLGLNGWELRADFCNGFMNMEGMELFFTSFIATISIFVLLGVALFTKNTSQLMEKHESKWFNFFVIFILILCVSLLMIPDNKQEFIYFQF